MWETIKKWILFMYFATGFIVGLCVPMMTGKEMGFIEHTFWIIFSMFAWLPITIVSIVL